MEQGKLLAKDVLPKVAKAYKEAALNGGAYEKALKGLTVTEGKLIEESQRAAYEIFKGGFSEGLSELYATLSDLLKELMPEMKNIGSVFGAVFKSIASGIRMVEPFLKILVSNFEWVFGAGMLYKITTMGTAITKLATGMKVSLASAFWPITAALAALEEIASLMSDKLVGTLERNMGSQFNLMTGQGSSLVERDGKYYRGSNQQGGSAGFSRTMEDAHWALRPAYAAVYAGQEGVRRLRGNQSTVAPTKQAPSQIITNHFNNTTKTEFDKIMDSMLHDAMHPQAQ